MKSEGSKALEELRVLDLSDGIAGAYCARLFTGYGADVIMVEPPAGHPLRSDADAWRNLAAGKRSVTLDIGTATGMGLFHKMTEEANLVIETFAAGELDSLGLGFAVLQGIKRRIVLMSLAPVAQSRDGVGVSLRLDDHLLTGLNAFAATAIAVHNADAHEVPQHIEIALRECAAAGNADRVPKLEAPPFTMSEISWHAGQAPRPGQHNLEIFCSEIGLETAALPKLRAAGVI